jgi:hypothetical protein
MKRLQIPFQILARNCRITCVQTETCSEVLIKIFSTYQSVINDQRCQWKGVEVDVFKLFCIQGVFVVEAFVVTRGTIRYSQEF